MRKLRSILLLVAMLALTGAGAGQTVTAQDSTPPTTGEPNQGTIEVHARLCDETPADGDWFTNCHESPLAEQVITAYHTQDGSTFDGTTDANGNVVLGVPPGEYELSGIPDDFLENSFIYCSTSDAGEEALYPVIIEAEQPHVICDVYMVPADLSGGIDINVHVNLCIAPGCTELPEAIEAADGVEVMLADVDDGTELGACTTAEGLCVVEDVAGIAGTTPVSVEVNEETVPDGYVVDPNPATYEIVPETPEVWLLLYPVDGFPPADDAVPLPVPLALELPASLYSASCANLDEATSAEPLSFLWIVDGEPGGSPDALQAASGYTELSMTVEDVLNGQYAIAVMDEDQNVIACGDVGGVLNQEGGLSIGLAEVDDSGAAGVAYLAPRGAEGEATGITTFIVPDGLIPADDVEIQLDSTPIG
jgi:hypothetical protein